MMRGKGQEIMREPWMELSSNKYTPRVEFPFAERICVNVDYSRVVRFHRVLHVRLWLKTEEFSMNDVWNKKIEYKKIEFVFFSLSSFYVTSKKVNFSLERFVNSNIFVDLFCNWIHI